MSAQNRDEVLAEAVGLRTRGEAERARELLVALADRCPDDSEVAYQTAWTHDTLGREAEAVPYYVRALAGTDLPDEDRRGAHVGLGSTFRVLGRYEEAVETLRAGVAEFPDDGALRTFLAMALFNTGCHDEAMRLLLELLATTSDDPYVRSYRRAIGHYAKDLREVVADGP
ncbi:tetratricopeptide repeat protein [Streptomyces sp. NBC_01498]|uniref:tetratricopeptide repeat protein n=1 Tax=Streptomyces sp. NBC_01498 TaxID=2975870 RepID=UPI002E7B27CD|nr:tetratricopeptide repeat protein [Streptomyces sp. NBC_01498]WTL24488.1 tetratricopeptide repeat protein [Streptomyces sp. NBC_01498]